MQNSKEIVANDSVEAPAAMTQASGSRSKRLLGIVISIVCLWMTFRQVNLTELVAIFKQINWQFIILGISSLGIGYMLRIQRWAIMLCSDNKHINFNICVAPFLGSIALNNILPFRAGDFVRALIFPKSIGIQRTEATASLILERLVDFLTLLICLSIGLLLNPEIGIPVWLKDTVFYLSFLGWGTLIPIILFDHLIYKIMLKLHDYTVHKKHFKLTKITSFILEFTSKLLKMTRPKIMIPVLIVSMLVWGAEAGLFWFFMNSLGLNISAVSSALFVMTIATLSTLLPSSPGYIGSFHFAAASAVMLIGASPAQAASFALLVHMGLWLPTTVVGGCAMLIKPQLFSGTGSNTSQLTMRNI